MTYGERFRYLRQQLWKGQLLELAKRLGTGYPSSVTNIERSWRVPNLTTLAKHATALGCTPWDLLEGVETEYDTVRALSKLPKTVAEEKFQALLQRYQESITRVPGGRRGRQPTAAEGQRARSTA